MTLSTELGAIRNKSVDQLRTDAYRRTLNDAKIDKGLVDQLLADGELGGTKDIELLQSRLAKNEQSNERALLDALTDRESPTPSVKAKPWTSNSSFKPPKGDLDAVRAGKLVLEKGQGGPAVGEVQKLLRDAGYPDAKHGIDQRYGDSTASRVRAFQTKNGLTPTGKVDKKTLASLESAAKKRTTSKAVDTAVAQFDKIAKDGFVSKEALQKIPGGKALADNVDALIFAHPTDPGAKAWHGLSKGDLQAIQKRLASGETLAQIVEETGHRRDKEVVARALAAFDGKGNDRFLNRDALRKLPGGRVLADRLEDLIFANIDPGEAAWHGLSRKDLMVIQAKLAKGASLAAIAKQLRQARSKR